MSPINSLIFEGEPTEVNFETIEQSVRTTFKVTSRRLLQKLDDGKELWENATAVVETYGNLAKLCEAKLNGCARVRVVGRLANAGDKLIIVGEHVEFVKKK